MAALPTSPIRYMPPDELRIYYTGGVDLEVVDLEQMFNRQVSRVPYFVQSLERQLGGEFPFGIPAPYYSQVYCHISKELDQDFPLKMKVKEATERYKQESAAKWGIPVVNMGCPFIF